MRELKTDGKFADQVTYRIIEKGVDDDYDDECGKYEFGSSKHGLVVLGADGSTVGKIDGHQFTKDDIVSAIEKALGG